MDLLLDLSLYPVNAVAVQNTIRTPQTPLPQPAERVNQVAKASPVRAEDNTTGSQRSPARRRQAAPAPPPRSEVAGRYPLSAGSVMARYG